jgi:hypothetical protein
MFKRVSIVSMVLFLFAGLAIAGEQSTTRGAKELFYDPEDRAVISTTTTTTTVTTPVPASASAAPARRSRSQTQAQAPAQRAPVQPVYDDSGRRLANVPVKDSGVRAKGLSYWIELVDVSGGPGVQVTDSRIFKSGERIRLHFRSNSDGRISIVQIGSSGTSSILFPDPAKGLSNNVLQANQDIVLPSPTHWFRFDENKGTERLLVFFAGNQQQLDTTFPTQRSMDPVATLALLDTAKTASGSKDLLIETETQTVSEIGTYAVNLAGNPIVLEIELKHE